MMMIKKYQLKPEKKYISKDEFLLQLSKLTEKYCHDMNKEITKVENTSISEKSKEHIKTLMQSYLDKIEYKLLSKYS